MTPDGRPGSVGTVHSEIGGNRWDVKVRRADGSLAILGAELAQDLAERMATRFSRAFHRGETWALNVVDVSAGQLRG